jgi:hypothetical protein
MKISLLVIFLQTIHSLTKWKVNYHYHLFFKNPIIELKITNNFTEKLRKDKRE